MKYKKLVNEMMKLVNKWLNIKNNLVALLSEVALVLLSEVALACFLQKLLSRAWPEVLFFIRTSNTSWSSVSLVEHMFYQGFTYGVSIKVCISILTQKFSLQRACSRSSSLELLNSSSAQHSIMFHFKRLSQNIFWN